MGDGRANERIDNVLNSQLQACLDATPKFGLEAYQRKADSAQPATQQPYVEVLAPGLIVPENYIAAPTTGAGSLADQVGLHGIDGGRGPAPERNIGNTSQAPTRPGNAYNQTFDPPATSTYPTDPRVYQPDAPVDPSGPRVYQPDAPVDPSGPRVYQPDAPVDPSGPRVYQPDAPVDPSGPRVYQPDAPVDPTDPRVYQPDAPVDPTARQLSQPTTVTDPGGQITPPPADTSNSQNNDRGSGTTPPDNQSGSQQVAPGFFRNRIQDQNTSGDPNQNGGNTQRPWRAVFGQVAPGFDRKTGVPSDPAGGRAGYGDVASGAGKTPGGEVVPKFGEKGPAIPQGTTGGGDTLAQTVEQKRATVEQSLDGGTQYQWQDFMLNSMLGGVSGYAFGGPLARALDYATKKHVVNSDSWTGLSIWYQQRHGLIGNEAVLTPLFERNRDLEISIKSHGDVLEPEIQKIYREAAERALSPEERAIVARHNLLTGEPLPKGLEGAVQPTEDVDLLLKKRDLGIEIQQLEEGRDLFKAHYDGNVQKIKEFEPKLDQLIKDLEPVGEPALQKWGERIEKGITADELKALSQTELDELAAARRYKFFTEFKKDFNTSAGKIGATLTAEEGSMVGELQIARNMVENLKPHADAQLEILPKRNEWNRLNTELEGRLKGLKEQIDKDGLLEKLNKAPETYMTAEEKAILARYNFLKQGGTGEIPTDVKLSADEARLVAERQVLQKKTSLLEPGNGQLSGLRLQREKIDGKLGETVKGLKDQVAEIEAKVAAHPERVLAPEEVIARARYQYLSKFLDNKGKVEAPVFDVLTAEDRALMINRALVEDQMAAIAKTELKAASGFKAHAVNFAKGVIAVEAAQLVDDRLNSLLFGKMKTKPSWYTDSLAVPAAMLVPGGWFKKGMTMVGAHVAGKILDSIVPAEDHPTWNRFVRPNNLEAISVAGAMLLPMRKESMPARLAYMGAAWLGSHAISYLCAGANPKEQRDHAFKEFSKDKTERSASSMSSAIDKFNDLGKNHESAVNFYLADWLSRKHDDLLTGYRGSAILFTSAGESRLEKGTFIPGGQGKSYDSKWSQLGHAIVSSFTGGRDQQFNYILAGKDIDIGGRALINLQSAKIELERAKDYTNELLQKDSNATIRGTKVGKSEVDGLNQVEKRVDLNLNKIYGKHDIADIYHSLEDYTYHLNQKQVGKIRDQIKGTLANPGTDDKRYVAKFWRDLALIDLAFAGVKVGYNGVGNGGDGASAGIMMKEAQAALQKARELDSNNEDTAQLDKIAQDISGKVPGATANQGRSNVNNPLGISNWK